MKLNIVKQGEAEDRKTGLKRRAKSWGGKPSPRHDRRKSKQILRQH